MASRNDAQWRVVYDMLKVMQPDDVLGHGRICDALDTRDMLKVHRLMSRAKRELWAELGRSVVAVVGAGYRMIRANEHGNQARRYERVARRSLGDAVTVSECAHLEELNDAEREALVKLQVGYALMARAVDESHRRLSHHDDLIAGLQQRVERLEDER